MQWKHSVFCAGAEAKCHVTEKWSVCGCCSAINMQPFLWTSDSLPAAILLQSKCFFSRYSLHYLIEHCVLLSAESFHLCCKLASFKAVACFCPHPMEGALKGSNEPKLKLQTQNWVGLITHLCTASCLFASLLLDVVISLFLLRTQTSVVRLEDVLPWNSRALS